MQRARALLGDGLLTSEEPLHMRQRRMAAPAFHRERIAAYGEVIGHYATEVTGRWQPGAMDVHPQMLQLALQIVGKCTTAGCGGLLQPQVHLQPFRGSHADDADSLGSWPQLWTGRLRLSRLQDGTGRDAAGTAGGSAQRPALLGRTEALQPGPLQRR